MPNTLVRAVHAPIVGRVGRWRSLCWQLRAGTVKFLMTEIETVLVEAHGLLRADVDDVASAFVTWMAQLGGARTSRSWLGQISDLLWRTSSLSVSAAMRSCPVAVTQLPAGGQQNCPVADR